MNILWCVTGPYPDPDTVIAYLLQTDLQAMMQEEGFAVPTGAGSASPASGGDKYAVSQNQERNNTTYRTNYNSQSSSEGRKSTGSNSRQSRLPPKRKDLESKFFFISRLSSLSVAYFPTVKVSQRTNQLL